MTCLITLFGFTLNFFKYLLFKQLGLKIQEEALLTIICDKIFTFFPKQLNFKYNFKNKI